MSADWVDSEARGSDRADSGGNEHGSAAFGDRRSDNDAFPDVARRAYIALLTNRYISRNRNRAAWEGLVAWESEIDARLRELFLDLVIDRDAEVAFKRQQDGDDVPRVLRREKPLSRDASFLLLFLRREYAFADTADEVVVTRDQMAEFLRAFRQDGDLDDAKFSRRVTAAIQALVKPLQLLTPDPAADYLFTVSPVVVPLIGADELRRLETAFRQAAETGGDTNGDANDGPSASADTPDDTTDTDDNAPEDALFDDSADPSDDEPLDQQDPDGEPTA